jgi:hypothetical protein
MYVAHLSDPLDIAQMPKWPIHLWVHVQQQYFIYFSYIPYNTFLLHMEKKPTKVAYYKGSLK